MMMKDCFLFRKEFLFILIFGSQSPRAAEALAVIHSHLKRNIHKVTTEKEITFHSFFLSLVFFFHVYVQQIGSVIQALDSAGGLQSLKVGS